MRLDRDATLSFQIHVIQQLFLHVPICHGTRMLQQSIRQGALAMIDVRYDAEIS